MEDEDGPFSDWLRERLFSEPSAADHADALIDAFAGIAATWSFARPNVTITSEQSGGPAMRSEPSSAMRMSRSNSW